MKMLSLRAVSTGFAICSSIVFATFAPAASGEELSDTLTPSSKDCSLDLNRQQRRIWVDDSVGNGFRSEVREAGLSLGGAFATHELGGIRPHDIVFTRFYYGWMLGEVGGGNSWFRGNWELIEELFGGVQVHPKTRYVIGESTLFRYNFATGTRWMPFIDGGGGVTASDIGLPDFGSVFEFNLQVGIGVNYFWRRNTAMTFQYRLNHMCNAGIRRPNQGVNANIFYLGITWMF